VSRRLTIILCALLSVAFGACGYLAVVRHSPTVDEPICALAGYLHVADGDFRFDADNPPLWKYWAMLPNLWCDLKPSEAGGGGGDMFVEATRRLFQTPGNDGDALIRRARGMMLLIGIALAASIAIWGWQVGGMTTALVACALFCFDPNFLAHAPLVKADVTVALLTFSIAWATWAVGRHARPLNIAVLTVLCGLAATVKYNTIFAAVIAATLLLGRALVGAPWPVWSRVVVSRAARLFVVMLIGLAALATTTVIIWASYGFRYEPSRSGGATLDLPAQVQQLQEARIALHGGELNSAAHLDAAPIPLVVRVAMFSNDHHLLPQAWLFGLVSIYRSSTTFARQSYLMDETSMTGWWYYFPVAMVAKTPLATLAAATLAGVTLVVRRRRVTPPIEPGMKWTILCLAVPTLAYLVASLTSSANAGVRHVLPLYPPIYILIGIAAATLKQIHSRTALAAAILLGAGLAVESLASFPHYLSFFNAAARPHRLYLLSDSNFDWGQDLKYVAAWQRDHPDVTLYLGYWGPVDPGFYGIRYVNIPGGFALGPHAPPTTTLALDNPPGVLMIGASLLQGVNFPEHVRAYYQHLRVRPPDRIVGDTIYLYDWPPRDR
jgi:hypothetical protein